MILGAHNPRNARAEVEVDRSITAVRMIFALIGSTVTIGVRTTESTLQRSLATAAIIIVVATAVSAVPPVLRRRRFSAKATNVILQTLDTVAALGLVHVLGGIAPDSAWVLFAVPIVVASLRLGSVGVVTVWMGSSAGYLALFWFDLHPDGSEALATSVIFERPGILLAVAACVAVLTRWLQEGWDTQALAAEESELRLRYVGTLERVGQGLQHKNVRDTVPAALHYALEFDLDAVTATDAGGETTGVGAIDLVPAVETIEITNQESAELITWHGDDGTILHSISLFEPQSLTTVTGWARSEISATQIDSFANLLALTSMHLELAGLLEGARYEAQHDPLTGLANRSKMDQVLAEESSKDQHLALLFLDLDRFKHINDTYGHQIGDDALVMIADRLRRIVGSFGTVARFGGDEFVVALAGDRAKAANDLARHLHDAIDGPVMFGEVQVEVGTSIGVSHAQGPLDPEDLLKAADDAVFAAKDAGRGTTCQVRLGPAASNSDGDNHTGGDNTGPVQHTAVLVLR